MQEIRKFSGPQILMEPDMQYLIGRFQLRSGIISFERRCKESPITSSIDERFWQGDKKRGRRTFPTPTNVGAPKSGLRVHLENCDELVSLLSGLCFPVFGSQPGGPDKQLRQPFLHTSLGKLPSEIRKLIYDYVLIVPSSQADVILITKPKGQTLESSDLPLKTTTPKKLPPLEPSDHTTGKMEQKVIQAPRKNSTIPALLQVRRLIDAETQHIYYGENTFQNNDADTLLEFMKAVRPQRRANISSLHLDGVVGSDRALVKEELKLLSRTSGWSDEYRQAREEEMSRCVHPRAQEAAWILRQCLHLKTLYLMSRTPRSRLYLLSFLQDLFGFQNMVIDFMQEHYWIVKSPQGQEDRWQWFHRLSFEWFAMNKSTTLCVKVDIMLETKTDFKSLAPTRSKQRRGL